MVSWYTAMESQAAADLQRAYGENWQAKHGIEVGNAEFPYKCAKCWSQLTCLEMVKQHISSNRHRRRIETEAYSQDPMADVPRDEWKFHEAREGRAYCKLCSCFSDEAHRYSAKHAKNVAWADAPIQQDGPPAPKPDQWYDALQSEADQYLRKEFGDQWQVGHGIVMGDQLHPYKCTKCWAKLSDLDTVRRHISGKDHQRRMQSEACVQKPLAEVPAEEAQFHIVKEGFAYCTICDRFSDSTHRQSDKHITWVASLLQAQAAQMTAKEAEIAAKEAAEIAKAGEAAKAAVVAKAAEEVPRAAEEGCRQRRWQKHKKAAVEEVAKVEEVARAKAVAEEAVEKEAAEKEPYNAIASGLSSPNQQAGNCVVRQRSAEHASLYTSPATHSSPELGMIQPVMMDVNPMSIRFTHDSISAAFRSGSVVDHVIDDALKYGPHAVASFPPMELVCTEDKLYSLSNRRLFMYRVLASLGVLVHVKAIVREMDGGRMQALRYDERLGRNATKWERSFTTMCDGVCVRRRSQYWEEHRSPSLEQQMKLFDSRPYK